MHRTQRIRQIVKARLDRKAPSDLIDDLVQKANLAGITSKWRPASRKTATGWLGTITARTWLLGRPSGPAIGPAPVPTDTPRYAPARPLGVSHPRPPGPDDNDKPTHDKPSRRRDLALPAARGAPDVTGDSRGACHAPPVFELRVEGLPSVGCTRCRAARLQFRRVSPQNMRCLRTSVDLLWRHSWWVMDRTVTGQRIRESVIEVEPRLEQASFTEDTTLADLGLDSLKIIEVGVRLEDAFGSGVRFDDWLDEERAKPKTDAFTVGSLISFIERGTTS